MRAFSPQNIGPGAMGIIHPILSFFLIFLLLQFSTFSVALKPILSPSPNPFTAKAAALRYLSRKIPISATLPLPDFIVSKLSPLSALDSATYTTLATNDLAGISTRLPAFWSAAHILCGTALGPSLASHRTDANFTTYGFNNIDGVNNFTNYGAGRPGGKDKFTNYAEDNTGLTDTFRSYSRGGVGHDSSFTTYSHSANTAFDNFTSYGSGATGGNSGFTNYERESNVPDLKFINYAANSNRHNPTFSSYSDENNAGDQSFAGYGKDGNGVPTAFSSYGTDSNIPSSTFTSYGQNGNVAVDTFTLYGKNGNVEEINFSNYGKSGKVAVDTFTFYGNNSNVEEINFSNYDKSGNASIDTFTSYRNQANFGDDSFKSYAKGGTGSTAGFTGYGNSINGGSDSFKGYGIGAINPNVSFKSYSGDNTTFKQYAKSGVGFNSYKNSTLIPSTAAMGKHKVSKMNRWLVEPGKFFRESNLKKGTVMPMPDIRDKMPVRSFLPRSISSRISSSADVVRRVLKIPAGTAMGKAVGDTMAECQRAPSRGETKKCAMSVEDVIDFAQSVLGDNAVVRSTQSARGSGENVEVGDVRGIDGGKITRAVSCHQSLFPYLVYYCHSVPKVRLYEVEILSANSKEKINHGVAICHVDTSDWSAGHGAFMALGSGPGKIEVCHWIFQGDMTWTV